MTSPLHYRIHPGALRVVVAPARDQAEPAALPRAIVEGGR
jgi:hypothetical protein